MEAGDCSISIDDQGRDQERIIDDAFGAENNREICLRSGRGNDGPRAFEEYRIGGRYLLPRAAVAGNEAFRKADEVAALDGRLSDGLFGQHDRLLGSRRESEVRERNSKCAHSHPNFIACAIPTFPLGRLGGTIAKPASESFRILNDPPTNEPDRRHLPPRRPRIFPT